VFSWPVSLDERSQVTSEADLRSRGGGMPLEMHEEIAQMAPYQQSVRVSTGLTNNPSNNRYKPRYCADSKLCTWLRSINDQDQEYRDASRNGRPSRTDLERLVSRCLNRRTGIVISPIIEVWEGGCGSSRMTNRPKVNPLPSSRVPRVARMQPASLGARHG